MKQTIKLSVLELTLLIGSSYLRHWTLNSCYSELTVHRSLAVSFGVVCCGIHLIKYTVHTTMHWDSYRTVRSSMVQRITSFCGPEYSNITRCYLQIGFYSFYVLFVILTFVGSCNIVQWLVLSLTSFPEVTFCSNC